MRLEIWVVLLKALTGVVKSITLCPLMLMPRATDPLKLPQTYWLPDSKLLSGADSLHAVFEPVCGF